MKIVRIEVDTCDDCPHRFITHDRIRLCMAVAEAREIQDTAEIPEFCPLPDAPEEKASA